MPDRGRPHEQFQLRAESWRQLACGAGVDAIVLKLPENILCATGHWVRMGGLCFAFVPARGAATLTVCDFELDDARRTWDGAIRTLELGYDKTPVAVAAAAIMAEVAEEADALGGRIGYEGGFEYLSHAVFGEATAIAAPTADFIRGTLQTNELVDVTAGITELRAVKNGWELDALRRVNEIADLGLNHLRAIAMPGSTEIELAASVEQIIRAQGIGHVGARDVRAYAMVCSGTGTASGWQPFRTTARTIVAGDLVMIEMGVVADGYWCDRTRTLASGRASTTQRRAYDAVRAAQSAAIAAAVPGRTGGAVDAVSRAACADHGFEQYPHHTGHGVGFGYHEMTPTLSPSSNAVLRADMVLAVEPGIYTSGLGGVRWEDTAVVTPAGGVVLGGADFDLE